MNDFLMFRLVCKTPSEKWEECNAINVNKAHIVCMLCEELDGIITNEKGECTKDVFEIVTDCEDMRFLHVINV